MAYQNYTIHFLKLQKTSYRPLFFVRSGIVFPAGNPPYLNLTGGYGYYWSSTSYLNDANYAYVLYFDTGSNVNPSYNVYRLVGYSLRCLAR